MANDNIYNVPRFPHPLPLPKAFRYERRNGAVNSPVFSFTVYNILVLGYYRIED